MITIRNAMESDIKDIREIAIKTWHHTYKDLIPEQVQDQFLTRAYSDEILKNRIKESLFLVAKQEDNVVGFANVFQQDQTAELSAIYIYPEYQGNGIGTKLFNKIISLLDSTSKIFVDVEKGNQVGEEFYRSKGFQEVKEFEDNLFGHTFQTKQLVFIL
ncbi:GNAT family N-acetyltransferase [Bacillaceae bacterium S4-13-56]